MTQLTNQGLTVSRLDERLTQLITAINLIFNVNIDPNSIDGQTLGIFAESINNLDNLAEYVYQSFDPNTATGDALSRLVLLNGIQRLTGFYSTAKLTLTGVPGTVVKTGSSVKDVNGIIWVTTADATIGAGGNVTNVPVQSSGIGPFTAAIGTITQIVTPVFGWLTATNPAIAVPGQLDETDEQLRARRRQSTSTAAVSIIDSMTGALYNTPGVTQVKIYENSTGAVDSNGIPAHSINAIVQGGDINDIAKVLYAKKSLGVGMMGATYGYAPDYTGNLPGQQMFFDRPSSKRIYCVVNVVKQSAYPVDGTTQIKNAIVAAMASQLIGQKLIWSSLFPPVMSVAGVSVTSLFIGTAPAPAGTANISVNFNEIASIAAADITVNES